MPHLRTVRRQEEAWANARTSHAPVDVEARWRECLVDVGFSGGPVARKHVRLASSNMDCAMLGRWCEWFRSYQASLRTRGVAKVTLDVVDLSRYRIGNRGLALLAELLLEHRPRCLKLFNNQISDATPVENLLSAGLRELHLSNNKLGVDAAVSLVVAAAVAGDESGSYLYPLRGVQPLWLRMENQTPTWPSDSFARELFRELNAAERPRAVCWVDGRTNCKPLSCTCAGGPRAVHLLHVGSSSLNCRRGMQRVAERRGQSPMQDRPNPPAAHLETWSTPVATWPSLVACDPVQFPPLPGQAAGTREAGATMACEPVAGASLTSGEGADEFPVSSPCYLLPNFGGNDSPSVTLGVLAEGVVLNVDV